MNTSRLTGSFTNHPKQYLHILTNHLLPWQRKPLLASYKLTYRCNLTCRQCPFHSMQGEDPGYNLVLKTLEGLYQRGNRIVIFEGGEPTLWRDREHTIHDVIDAANRLFFVTGMTTNGSMDLNINVKTLWVSMDGFRNTHNALRGADIFDRIIDNIQKSNHPRIFAHITINKLNAPEIPDLIPFLSKLVKGITVQFYYPYTKQEPLFLELEERSVLIERIIELKQAGYPVQNSIRALRALQKNNWRCIDHLIDNANPDGTFSQGCYLKGRGEIDCQKCGFTPHTEISLACQGSLQAIRAGLRIFF